MEKADDLENPIAFPKLAKFVTPDQIKLLKNYRDATKEKIDRLHMKISGIEK